MIKFLLWLGIVRMGRKNNQCHLTKDGVGDYLHPLKVIWPIHLCPPRHIVRYMWRHDRRPYLFRNLPGVIKYEPGRLLPKRWGGGWLGFEIGDRG